MGVANLNGDGTIPKESDEWVIAEGEKQRQEAGLWGGDPSWGVLDKI